MISYRISWREGVNIIRSRVEAKTPQLTHPGLIHPGMQSEPPRSSFETYDGDLGASLLHFGSELLYILRINSRSGKISTQILFSRKDLSLVLRLSFYRGFNVTATDVTTVTSSGKEAIPRKSCEGNRYASLVSGW